MTTVEHRPGPEPALFFLHGLGGNHQLWRPQLDEFADRACLAWDLPGYADSPALPEITFPSLAREVVAVLDRVGVDKAVLVGHSLGGMIAQQTALDWPERISALVLVGTTAVFGKPGSSFNEQFLGARLNPIVEGRSPADFAPDLVASLVGPHTPRTVRDDVVAAMSNISSAAYEAILRCLITWDARDRLEAIACPTLCLAGEHDTTASPTAVERLADQIPGARFAVIADAGHLSPHERPDEFNRRVREFLS